MRFNIICVDEFGITRIELAGILKNLNINFINVKDETDAENVLESMKTPVNAIIWTINSVDMKDFESIKRLKELDSFKNIPVIIISKFTDKKYVIRAIEAGAVEYIAKPYDEAAVLRKICKAIGVAYDKALDKSLDDDIVTYSFSEMFNKEIKAASRGKYPMTIMLASVVPNKAEAENKKEIEDIALLVLRILKTRLRETDIAFQYGSNNMVLLLPFAGRDDVDGIKKKIFKMFSDHTAIKQKNLGYALKISSVTFPDDGKVKDKLLEKLELALDSQVAAKDSQITGINP
ncbi:MAG: response regulator [Bacillota bacterium]|nr:response regulator [Bacillota bacterium]